ncbi:hypothetical protein SEA_SATIS_88 [Streptomyces phage Satis]|nr:hypothetical protein SEA_SATIS_88 [Streptomyces phage Satis]QBZ71986.1 hypothetical protein SEA_KRADAL_88 [Streptomyces phage Kradal]QPL14405.1 hypothetical protein SEA_EHYELIMAYOE_88 [Streptomyces phage EhyElimayoE]
MAGRPKSEQGDEKREHRTVIRWTKSEKDRLAEARKKMGLTYEVDVVRILALRGLKEMLPEGPENVAE